MKKKRVHKNKGISPLIASVLLIGFVIVLGSMVMIWGGNIFEKYKTSTEEKSMIKLDCATKVDLNIKQACIFGDKIKFSLENLGDKEISSFVVRVIGDKTDVDELEESLSPFSVSKFETEFDANPVVGIGIPKTLEIFPRITYEGKEGTCPESSIKLESCYKLPSLLSFDDWNSIGNGYAGVAPEELNVNGLGIVLSGNNKLEIKSKSFIIPNEVKKIKIGGKINNENSVYSLKYLDDSNALILSENINGNIQPTLEIPSELKEKEVYFSLIVDGRDEDYALLSELCYTDGIYCKI